jgi:hypothetical protein
VRSLGIEDACVIQFKSSCRPWSLCRGRRISVLCAACPRTSSGRRCRRVVRSRCARTRVVLEAWRTLLPAAPRQFSRSRGRCRAYLPH